MYSFLFFCIFVVLLSLSGAVTSVSPPSDEAAKARVSTAPKTKDSEVDRKWGITESSSSGPTSNGVPTGVGSVDDLFSFLCGHDYYLAVLD